MTRIEFTKRIVTLLDWMSDEGESPILDFCKRSDEEQKRLFEAGLSKCDGQSVRSRHQSGMAVDLYFQDVTDVDKDGNKKELIPPLKGFDYWHQRWEELGGAGMIDWDKGHFEA